MHIDYLPGLVMMACVALANNLCFVAVAKLRNYRLDKVNEIKKLKAKIEELENKLKIIPKENTVETELVENITAL